MNDPISIAWVSWDDPNGGYGHVGMQLRKAFHDIGARAHNSYSTGWDALICVATPVRWILGPSKEKRPDLIYHTMFEAQPIPDGWVDNVNQSGLFWAPSTWVLDLYRNHGCTIPAFVTGYAVDTRAYSYIDRRGRDQKFRVLVWADTLVSRKNALLAARAFQKANLPDAEMQIKININGMSGAGAFYAADGSVDDRISIISANWPREEIVRWLHSGDCLLYPSGGEGYGLMPLEAMATGLPVICSYNTGMTEYLTSDRALLIPSCGKTKSINLSSRFKGDYMIEKPDFDTMVDHLRWLYHHREKGFDLGDTAAAYTRTWTWEDVARKALGHITSYVRTGAP